MARRARRSTNSRFVGSIQMLTKEVKKKIVSSAKTAARQIVKDLRVKGPFYTGTFRDSWYYEDPNGRKSTAPSMTLAMVTTPKAYISIGNSASYADQAMDLVPYISGPFPERKGPPPIKIGLRPDGAVRGLILPDPKGNNTSTAQLYWFDGYMNGGSFAKSFREAADRGFKKPQ